MLKRLIKKLMNAMKEKKYVPVPFLVYNEKLLDGKIALVTGGSSGIGYSIAEAFLKNGCKVIIAGRNETKLKEAKDKLSNLDMVKYMVLDVSAVDDLAVKVQEANQLFPEHRIDILVNSAGMMAHGDFFDMDEEQYNTVMDINAKGTYFMSQQVAKDMIEKKVQGHILNISSAAAMRPAWSPYQVSKWAVNGMTKGLADVLIPYGITVNAIAPGPTATPMLHADEKDVYHSHNPSGRFALPEEIAALAAYMVSDMGNLIVGDTFYITGGGGTISFHR